MTRPTAGRQEQTANTGSRIWNVRWTTTEQRRRFTCGIRPRVLTHKHASLRLQSAVFVLYGCRVLSHFLSTHWILSVNFTNKTEMSPIQKANKVRSYFATGGPIRNNDVTISSSSKRKELRMRLLTCARCVYADGTYFLGELKYRSIRKLYESTLRWRRACQCFKNAGFNFHCQKNVLYCFLQSSSVPLSRLTVYSIHHV